jgi:hypothetical protein
LVLSMQKSISAIFSATSSIVMGMRVSILRAPS